MKIGRRKAARNARLGGLLLASACWLACARSAPSPLPALPTPAAASAACATLADGHERFAVRHARRLRMALEGDAVRVEIQAPWQRDDEALRYLLVPHGHQVRRERTEAPDDKALRIVEVPVRRLAVTSTTELGHLAAFDAVDRVVGFPQPGLMVDPRFWDRREAGTLRAIGAGGSGIDAEALLATESDVLVADFASRDALEALAAVEDAGLTVLLAPTFLESTPLGRAEWGVLLGLLVGEGEAARERFAAVEAAYCTLRERVSRERSSPARDSQSPGLHPQVSRPRALVGGPWNEVWHVPRAGSYPAHLLADAGADYVWGQAANGVLEQAADRDWEEATADAGAAPLDLERVFERAGDAAWWFWPGAWRSLAEIRAADERLGEIAAARGGRVVAADRRLVPSGGNDYWESGPGRPDLVLADLVRLLHPDLLPGHELVYHRLLEETAPAPAGAAERDPAARGD